MTLPSTRLLVLSLTCVLTLSACDKGADDIGGTHGLRADRALNGEWSDSAQNGGVSVTELRFDNGAFEWTFDNDLQQRGAYDTDEGVLTVTIEHDYGYPQRSLADYSRPYAVVGDTLTWGANRWVKK